jgi:MFS family permease
VYITLRDEKLEKATRSASARPRVAGTVILLGIVSLLTDISSESVNAILPLYFQYLGFSMVAYGFLDGLYQGVSAVTRIAAGAAADREDRPKWVAVGGYGLSAFARVGLLFFHGFGLITTVISADRIGKGIRTAPRDAMISASSTEANLGRSFGVHRALDTTGAVIGPLAAFGILWAVVGGYDIVIAVSLAFALLGLAVLVFAVRDIRPRRETGTAGAVSFRVRDILTPQLRRVVTVAAVLSLVTVGDGFIYLALLKRGEFAAHWFPMLYVGTNLAYMALAIPFGRLADRVGRIRVFVGGHLFLLAAYAFAVVPFGGWLPTVLTLLLLGAFYAGTDGVLAAIAGRSVPVQSRASGIAVAQTAVAVARLVSSTAFGLIWFLVGPSVALIVVGAALAALIGPAYAVLRPMQEARV